MKKGTKWMRWRRGGRRKSKARKGEAHGINGGGMKATKKKKKKKRKLKNGTNQGE